MNQNRTAARISRALMICMMVLFAAGEASLADRPRGGAPKQVLLLNSYHKGYLWSDEITRGVEETLVGSGVDLHVEYMDTKRQFDAEYQELLSLILRLKHSMHTYDLVITSDNNAFDFYRSRGTAIFGETPIVFCGLNYLRKEDLEGIHLATGVNEEADIEANLSLITSLHPDCRKIVVITDNTTSGKRVQERVLFLKGKNGRTSCQIELLYDVTIGGLGRQLGNLSPHTIVLFTFFFRDKEGRFFEFDRGAQFVCENASVPVYGAWHFTLGYGIVGGYLISGFKQGTLAAEKARLILSGTSVADIPVTFDPSTDLSFDFRQLQRHNISLDRLPGGSEILYRPVSFYSRHKRLVWSTLSVFFVSLLLAGLLGVTWGLIRSRQAAGKLRQSEEKLRHLQNYLSNIIDSMPSLLIGVNAHGHVTQWNKTAEQHTGITAARALGEKLSRLLPHMDPEMELIAASIQNREPKLHEKRQRQLESGTGYEEITIYPLVVNGVEGAVIRIDDVTHKVRMEEMMIQSEKMLSVGGLAAGMAHEINNPLAGLMQTASVLESRLGTGPELPANIRAAETAGTSMEAIRAFMKARNIPQMLTAITESGRRVAAIIENMLSFARKSESSLSHVALDQLIDKTLSLAATDFDLKKKYDFKQIDIVRSYQEGLPLIPCEPSKIQQVLMNILKNGAEAMQEAQVDSPRFIIRTGLDRERDMATIEIEDNGPGMSEALCKRVFEPFYTTKPEGVGTGLGLSVSYFIIAENHCGEMTVRSSPGSGATFAIGLPLKKDAEL